MLTRRTCLALLAAIAIGQVFVSGSRADDALVTVKRLVSPRSASVDRIIPSPDGARAAVLYAKGEARYIQVGDRLYAGDDSMSGFTFSANGARYAFWYRSPTSTQTLYNACLSKPIATTHCCYDLATCNWSILGGGGKYTPIRKWSYYIQVDTETHGPFDNLFITPRLHDPRGRHSDIRYASDSFVSFSPVSGDVAFGGMRDKQTFVRIANRSIGPYGYSEMGHTNVYLHFSDDLGLFGYEYEKMERGDRFGVIRYAQIGGTTYGPYDFLKHLTVTANGAWAFAYQKGDGYYVKLKGADIGPFPVIRGFGLSDDGRRYYVWYREQQANYLRVNDAVTRLSHDGDGITDIFANRGLSKIAVRYMKGSDYYIDIDGKTYGPSDYHGSIGIRFGDTGDGYAVWHALPGRPARCYLHLPGKTIGPYASIKLERLSPDGLRYGIVYQKDGKRFAGTTDATHGPFESVVETAFSDDARRCAVIYSSPKKIGSWDCYVRVDGKVFGPYRDARNFSFSPDGRRYGFTFHAHGDGRMVSAVVDGTAIPRFAVAPAAFSFTKDNRAILAYCDNANVTVREVR